jgi:hypothetical protein
MDPSALSERSVISRIDFGRPVLIATCMLGWSWNHRITRSVASPALPCAIVPRLPEEGVSPSRREQPHVIVLIDDTSAATEPRRSADSIAKDHVRFVHFDIDREETQQLQESWKREERRIELEIVAAPIRELADAAVFLARTARRDHKGFVTVILGDVVPRWWQRPLHVGEARTTKAALVRDPGTVLILVPYQL